MTELLLGAGIGWAAGLTPGPLHTLVMVTSIRRGFRAGAAVALAPPIADAPIVPIALFLVGAMSDTAIRALSFAGGVFVIGLGVATMRSAGRPETTQVHTGSDLAKGIVTNLLSPHPWLFWLTVGGPILVTAWTASPVTGLAFLVGFYGLLVGSKIGVAFLASHGRRLAGTPWYARLVAGSGLLLVAMGAFLLRDAVVR